MKRMIGASSTELVSSSSSASPCFPQYQVVFTVFSQPFHVSAQRILLIQNFVQNTVERALFHQHRVGADAGSELDFVKCRQVCGIRTRQKAIPASKQGTAWCFAIRLVGTSFSGRDARFMAAVKRYAELLGSQLCQFIAVHVHRFGEKPQRTPSFCWLPERLPVPARGEDALGHQPAGETVRLWVIWVRQKCSVSSPLRYAKSDWCEQMAKVNL